MDIKELQTLAQIENLNFYDYKKHPNRYELAKDIENLPTDLRTVDYRDIYRIWVAQRDEEFMCNLFNAVPATEYEQQALKIDFYVDGTPFDVKSTCYRPSRWRPSKDNPAYIDNDGEAITLDLERRAGDKNRGRGRKIIYVLYSPKNFYSWTDFPAEMALDKSNWYYAKDKRAAVLDLRTE